MKYVRQNDSTKSKYNNSSQEKLENAQTLNLTN